MPLTLILSTIEARVLGSLIEKELTTPEYYPLTLNSLMLACNQKSNRDPMMSLSEDDVMIALDALRSKQLAWQRSVVGARTIKYEHNLPGKWSLAGDEIATLCVLLLRGPQTIGEIKGRAGRMHEFPSLTDVEATIQRLMTRDDGAFVCKLPRSQGHKENRFAHLLCGEPEVPQEEIASPAPVQSGPGAFERITHLESAVKELRDELDGLRLQFGEFKKQFE